MKADQDEVTPLIKSADHPSQSHSRRNEIVAVIGVTLALFATGNMAGFSAISLPSFLDPTSDIQASQDQLSWIASMANVGSIVGNIMGGLISDLVGRKTSITFSSIVFFTGWLTIAEATSVNLILIGRVLTGWAAGLCSSPVQVYICEVASAATRGSSGAAPSLTVTLGMLSIFSFGSILNWRIVAFLCSAIPVVVVIYVLCLPESPTWLVSKGRDMEALETLLWLRQSRQESQKEFDIIRSLKESRNVDNENENSAPRVAGPMMTHQRKKCRFLRRFLEWSVLRPFLIGTSIFFLQSCSGIYPITAYTTLIFRYADKFWNPYIETVFVGLIRMLSVIAAIFVVNKFPKRRPLLMTSGIFTCLANSVLGGYFYWKETVIGEGSANFTFIEGHPSDIDLASLSGVNLEWLPLTCILVFVVGYSIGFGIIPWFLMAELMPADVRSVCCSIAFALGQIFLFTAVKTFLDIVDLVGAHGAFWAYGVMSFISVLFVFVFVPETANLDDKQIEQIFAPKNKLDKNNEGNC